MLDDALNFCRMITLIRYTGINFTFGLWIVFVITVTSLYRGSLYRVGSVCSIHFVVTLAGLKNIVRFTGTSLNDLISGFHCTMKVIFSRFGRYSVSINQLN